MAAARVDKSQPGFLKKAAESLADQMETYRSGCGETRRSQERYQVRAEQRKEERDRRHRQYIDKETAARQQRAQYNEAIRRQVQQQVSTLIRDAKKELMSLTQPHFRSFWVCAQHRHIQMWTTDIGQFRKAPPAVRSASVLWFIPRQITAGPQHIS